MKDKIASIRAVELGSAQIKTRSACRSERIATCKRLLEIESDLGARSAVYCPIEPA